MKFVILLSVDFTFTHFTLFASTSTMIFYSILNKCEDGEKFTLYQQKCHIEECKKC